MRDKFTGLCHAGVMSVAAASSSYAALGLLATQRRWRRAYAHEQALAQENALLHARWQGVLEATQQGVWDVDVRTGHTYYSPMWKKMLGYSDDAIAPTLQAWTQRIHPDDLAPTLQAWQRHIDGDSALSVGISLGIDHFHHQQFVMRQSVMAYGTNNLSSDDCQFHTRLRGVFQVKAPPTLRRR